jgi:hypothetical protein
MDEGDIGHLPILASLERFAEKTLGRFGVAGRREVEVDRIAALIDRTVETRGRVGFGIVDSGPIRNAPTSLPRRSPPREEGVQHHQHHHPWHNFANHELILRGQINSSPVRRFVNLSTRSERCLDSSLDL